MTAVVLGLSLGLASGISPGPMFALVVSTSLRWGPRHGVAVACAPLVSDTLIVGVTLATLGRLSAGFVAGLGVVGGIVIALMGIAAVRDARSASLTVDSAVVPPSPWRALQQGILVNIANPHPWLAWATALGPLTVTTWRESVSAGLVFLISFYVAIVGVKMLIAVAVARGRHRLTGPGYRAALLIAGLALLGLGIVMTVEFAGTLLRGPG